VKSGNAKASASADTVASAVVMTGLAPYTGRRSPALGNSTSTTSSVSSSGRQTPSGRSTPQPRSLSPLPEDRMADLTPRPFNYDSRQGSYASTAASVNRIISRHRQQPSIASIISDISAAPGADEDTRSSTPATATSSSHPTPPSFHGAVFVRSVSSTSPTPRAPVVYQDDFGIKSLMAIVNARAREEKVREHRMREKRGWKRAEVDPVERRFYGERIDWATEGIHPDIAACFGGTQEKLDRMDMEIDELLSGLMLGK